MAEIFGTSYEILKGRDYGLEDIVNLLREYELTEEEKKRNYYYLKTIFDEKGKLVYRKEHN